VASLNVATEDSQCVHLLKFSQSLSIETAETLAGVDFARWL